MFDQLAGNERAKQTLRRMLRQRRVPGALLFAGDEGLGKKLFAVELARAFNCRSPRGVEGCGECPACVRAGRLTLPAEDARDDFKKVIWSEHRDVGHVVPFKNSIPIDSIRDLERESNFQPFEGNARVFIIEEADKLGPASNALLKTLEEPSPKSHIILLTSRPAWLLPTIRSRCQTIRFAPLGAEELEEFLVKSRKRAGEEARLAARLAAGRPGVAASLNLDRYRAQRDWGLKVIEALGTDGDRSRLLRAAEELSDAKQKDDFEPRLDALETLSRDLWLLALAGGAERIVNADLRERLARLSAGLNPARPARWIARVEELRRRLTFNVNRRIAADALLLGLESD